MWKYHAQVSLAVAPTTATATAIATTTTATTTTTYNNNTYNTTAPPSLPAAHILLDNMKRADSNHPN